MLASVPPTSAPPRLVLVSGDEELLVSRAVRDVIHAARRHDPQTEIVDRAPGEFTESDVVDLASVSMFGELRVVVVRGAQELTDDLREALLAYLARPLDDVVLVVVHSGVVRNRKLAEAMKSAGATVVTAARITRPRDRHDFVAAEVRRLGGQISAGAVKALVDAVGSDLRELAMVCDQMVADSGGTINEALVAGYRRGRAEATGFAVADAAIAGDLPEALTVLRQTLAGGVPPVLVVSAMTTGLRDLARVAAAGGGSTWELARSLGMPDWKVERSQRAARGWSDEGLAYAMRAVSAADAAVKGGAVDPVYGLERLVTQIVSARGRPAGARR
ncbi:MULTISPECIES: DNA polymerase III subunit delta [Protofrankia]|uniref:DNA polymerase III subunit delta n=1 Tax=Candidatus Protofrankia datiscae TaxID=2716812 RepID=F8B3W7_9ACTN|nr:MULTISPECIES: DNA polymerase III subunit delta [Protofrankia]AEH09067.1 DNA polymerase III, delta subunit [Candidatus Protofrankia datiscae]